MVFQITRSLLIVDEMIDGRVVAADFAGCTLLYLDGAEVHRLGIEGEQSVGEQFAHTEEVLQRLGSLDGSEHTSDGTRTPSWLLVGTVPAGGGSLKKQR